MTGDPQASVPVTAAPVASAAPVATASQREALRIEADWLVLRPWRLDDIAWVFDACQDAEIQRWTLVPSPYAARHAAGFVTIARAALLDGLAYHLCIADAEREETLGAIGVKAPCGNEAEIGYWVGPEARGRGVASTALDALTRWCFDALDLYAVTLRISPANIGSLGVARRCGFVETERQIGGCHDGDTTTDAVVMRRLRMPR